MYPLSVLSSPQPHPPGELFLGDKGRVVVLDNVRVFDGLGRVYERGVVVVGADGRIRYAGSRGGAEIPGEARIIDGEKQTALPGLIDAHLHLLGMRTGDLVKEPLITPIGVFYARAVKDLEALLNAGFTTIRDCGGIIALHLRDAVAEGSIEGPRIVAAGLPISQTFGHGDTHYLPVEWVDARTTRKMTPLMSLICDGPSECRKAARYALREGADFIKIFSTGGVLSQRDRPEHPQFTLEEIKAIVEEARRTGRLVGAHAQGAEGIKNAIMGGVKTIAHAILIDEEAVEMSKEKNVVLVPTLSISHRLVEKGAEAGVPEWGLRKAEEMLELHVENIRMAYRHGAKIATGTDFIGGPMLPQGENALEIKLLVEKIGMSPVDALVAATRNAAEAAGLLDETGTLEEGKLADIILVRGNPTQNPETLQNPNNITLVMKEGRVYKNTLKEE